MDVSSNPKIMDNPSEDSDTEEALSLCDLPFKDLHDLSCNETDQKSPGHEFFEFFNNRNQETVIRPAEEIISAGKLLPYQSPPHAIKKSEIDEQLNRKHFIFGRSDSLKESLQRSNSSVKSRLMRSNCSLDYRKLQRASSNSKSMREREISRERNLSRKGEMSFRKEAVSVSVSPVKLPRWHLLLFGSIKTPPEMELKDIRNRQSRRIPSSMFPNFDDLQTVSVKRDGGKGSWKLFGGMSCKGHADVVVTASLGCIPHVSKVL